MPCSRLTERLAHHVDGLLQKSQENWEAASLCLSQGLWNAAASRFYYSVFQAILLSATRKPVPGISVPSDSSAKHGLMERVVGAIGKDARRAKRSYGRLLALREKADYKPEPVARAEIEMVLQDAKSIRQFFLNRLEA